MDRITWNRLKTTFLAARRLPTAERGAFLTEACGDDAALRAEVEDLLAAGVDDDPTAARSAEETARANATGAGDEAGGRIGPYELIDVLGEGGFGTVYRARQHEPIQREVALKLLKLGMDSRQIVARFEAERQTLARMDHPNIAKVHDAGITAGGRPFFVMELVHGLPITDYCDARALTTPQRVELILQVCLAVQHAHQKGIIHRDLKPSNVLVEEVDGTASPRVIDFGIAKATDQDAQRTAFTLQHQLVGTPEYMAPEQAGGASDVDTRADVYSLGVLLYELLTGTCPFDLRALLEQGYAVLLGHIRDVTPPKPSTRVSELGDARDHIARRRGVTPQLLGRVIRGDLDWIVMRALEKERDRRYETVGALADDLRRFMQHEPVNAGPPSAAYRVRKFARRHRTLFVAAAGLVASLAISVVALSWSVLSVRSERDRANRKADTAARVSGFLADLFEGADPRETRGEARTARELLDAGAASLDALTEEPDVQAVLRNTIGGVYLNLGEFRSARALLEAALRHLDSAASSDRRELARCLHRLAVALDAGDNEPARAEELARRAVALWEELGEPGMRADSLNTLATTLWHQGREIEAEPVFREAIATLEASSGPGDPRVFSYLANLGSLRLMAGDYDEAGRIYRRVLEFEERQPDHGRDFDHATTLHLLALVDENLGRHDDAIAYELRSLAIREAVLGPDHWHVALSLTTLANLYRATDRAAEAVPLARRAAAIAEGTWDKGADLWWAQRSLASALVEVGEHAEARQIAVAQLGALERAEEPVWAPLCQEILGDCDRAAGQLAQAAASYRAALGGMGDDDYAPDDPDRIRTMRSLAAVLRAGGEVHEAEELEAEVAARQR